MTKSNIDGLIITELKQICDERGAVLHMLRIDAPDYNGFGECYFSEIHPGVVKAWKRHRAQTQNFTVPIGRIRVVIYDGRVNSNTAGEIQKIELGRPDAYIRLQIPPGVWYGFSCIGKISALLANIVDQPHDPRECEVCSVDNSEIPYNWVMSN